MRISELVGLDLSDTDFAENGMHVIRKGGKDDTVYFNGTVLDALKDYITLERPKLMVSEKEPALSSSPTASRGYRSGAFRRRCRSTPRPLSRPAKARRP